MEKIHPLIGPPGRYCGFQGCHDGLHGYLLCWHGCWTGGDSWPHEALEKAEKTTNIWDVFLEKIILKNHEKSSLNKKIQVGDVSNLETYVNYIKIGTSAVIGHRGLVISILFPQHQDSAGRLTIEVSNRLWWPKGQRLVTKNARKTMWAMKKTLVV